MNIPGVTVRNDGSHVVDIWGVLALLRGQFASGIPVLPVMHLLSLEQSLNLVRYGVVRVVAKVGGDLVGSGQQGRARPARDIQDLLVGGLLGHLDGVNGTHYAIEPLESILRFLLHADAALTRMNRLPLVCPLIQQIEQFPRHQRAGVCLLQRPALAHDVLGGVWSLDALIPRGVPPRLDIANLLFIEGVFRSTSLVSGREQLVRVSW